MSDNSVKIPIISQDLLDYLHTKFPLKPPALEDNDRKIWMDVGKQAVIDHLEYIKEKQSRGELQTCVQVQHQQ